MIEFVLTDIEGTTTSIDFVHQNLFSYASDKLESFLFEHGEEAEIAALLPSFMPLWQKKNKGHSWSSTAQLVTLIRDLIREDSKDPALKKLQGHIWRVGYESGDVKGHVYDDVPQAFKRWQEQGLKIGIYSSGSVLAQRLLFGHSVAGDLNSYISANFDTQVGAKREPSSYSNISTALKLPPEHILFLSDIAEELQAAQQAGMKVLHLARDRNSIIPGKFDSVSRFSDIKINAK